jgi:GntR family transcriptional regulator
MFMRIEPASSQPLFEQITFGVKGAVASGALPVGARLPSVRELARELTINPNTVAKAYAELEAQGVIVRRQGSGCFVAERASALSERERRRRLSELIDRLVVEAYHLGHDPEDVRAALEARLKGPARKRSRSKPS